MRKVSTVWAVFNKNDELLTYRTCFYFDKNIAIEVKNELNNIIANTTEKKMQPYKIKKLLLSLDHE